MTKILWLNNLIPPYPSIQMGDEPTPMGGWLMSMANRVKDKGDFRIAIAAPASVSSVKSFSDGDFDYYLFPISERKQSYHKSLSEIVDKFSPDIVQVNGTEMKHAQDFFDIDYQGKTIIVIQGLISEIANYFNAGMSEHDIRKSVSLKEIIRGTTINAQKKAFIAGGRREVSILKKCDMIIGRTDWDYAGCMKMGVEDKYVCVNENLRESFYNNQWDINKCKRHTIFTSAGYIPYKGVHTYIEAAATLKRKYPDIMCYIAGPDLFKQDTIIEKLKRYGYAKYLKRLVDKYDVADVIKFTGMLSEEEMCKAYLDCNVFVQTSYIENSPNALGEAVCLGVPIVASLVGGTEKYVTHKKNGLLYPAGNANMISYYVSKLLDNDEMAREYGQSVREEHIHIYDRDKNAADMADAYKKVLT